MIKRKKKLKSGALTSEEIATIGAQFCCGLLLGWTAGVLAWRLARCPALLAAAVAALLLLQAAESLGWLEVEWRDVSLVARSAADNKKIMMIDWIKENIQKLRNDYRVFSVGFVSAFTVGFMTLYR